MFDSTKEDLKDILRDADAGMLQLPDFQRDYLWADEDVRSLIAKRSNIVIGGGAPSVYLAMIEKDTGVSSAELDALFRSHLIEPELLRADDFEGLFAARLAALSQMIGNAIGKNVVLDHGRNEPDFEMPDEQDESEIEVVV